jgi:AcrR family transcriptional regulator
MEFNDKQIQIIEIAEQLFADRGFDGTSVRDIAHEAGVNIAMISYYFGSKEKLMEALLEWRVGEIKIRVESLIKDDRYTPLEKVNMLIDEHIDRAMQKQSFHKIMVSVQVTNKNPSILKAANKVKIRNAKVIAELIKDGQKKGVFKKNIDLILMLNTLVGTVNQNMMSLDYYREFNGQIDMTDEAFQIIIKKRLSIHIKKLFKAMLTNES